MFYRHLQDLQGPKDSLFGQIKGWPAGTIGKWCSLTITTRDIEGNQGIVSLYQSLLMMCVKPDDRILLDVALELRVTD